MVNMMSDTVTKPSAAMLEAMMAAEVGDDVLGTDPTVISLEQRVAQMFAKEAAVFCPSGTMTNQIAIKCHTEALDEMICDIDSHVYRYETAGFAYNSGISVALIHGKYGKITAQQIEAKIQADQDWLPHSSLVVLENTCNKGGGGYYTISDIEPIKKLCQAQDLALHLDGARLFNALEETKETTQDIGPLFDSISICMSKGLGAPVGSLLLGTHKFIKKARRFRKVLGGGMRQAGYLAAACHYALDHNIQRLSVDHQRAKMMAEALAKLSFINSINPVYTNIIIFHLNKDITASRFIDVLKEKGILASPFGPHAVRFVTHLDITEEQFNHVLKVLNGSFPF